MQYDSQIDFEPFLQYRFPLFKTYYQDHSIEYFIERVKFVHQLGDMMMKSVLSDKKQPIKRQMRIPLLRKRD